MFVFCILRFEAAQLENLHTSHFALILLADTLRARASKYCDMAPTSPTDQLWQKISEPTMYPDNNSKGKWLSKLRYTANKRKTARKIWHTRGEGCNCRVTREPSHTSNSKTKLRLRVGGSISPCRASARRVYSLHISRSGHL